ncbi:MAG: CHAT domain-containing protein, partial [Cyanobacteria bacterium]|nr:CHAT domain-containing protein [Cyanobacteriota bacterium]
EDGKTSGVVTHQVDSLRQFQILRSTQPTDGSQKDSEKEPARTDKMLLVGALDFTDAPPLPGTGEEVKEIAALSKSNGISALLLTGAKGNKPAVLADLPGCAYVHFATHGYFDAGNSSAKSNIAQSPTSRVRSFRETDETDEAIAAQNILLRSGLLLSASKSTDKNSVGTSSRLTALEVLNVDLSKCTVVALSACETGRGEQVTGQGVIGLRASVIAAGARNVLMSLWKVDDRATAKLMKLFYSNLWQKNESPSAALRDAQDELRRDPAFADPFYWAAWIIVGDS